MKKETFKPLSFVLQWHITENCNWRCKHCYQDNYDNSEMNLEKSEEILNQYVNLIKKWHLPKNHTRIQVTGGEPFIKKDFFQFLDKINAYSDFFYWTIMSNGSFLNQDNVKKLKLLGIDRFQLSIEGKEKTNDEIRSPGSFQKTLKAIELLKAEKIPVCISFTASKYNYKEIKEIALTLASLGADILAIRRIVPFGAAGSSFKNHILEPYELQNLYNEIEKINELIVERRQRLIIIGGCENAVFNDEISMPRLMSHDYCCIPGGRILTILPNADVLICRRYPVKIGNLYEKTLEEIYYDPEYESLRNKEDIPAECHFCPNFSDCLGGAKCVTYALTGKTAPDVQCWKLFNNLKEAISYIKNPDILKKINLLTKNFYKKIKEGKY